MLAHSHVMPSAARYTLRPVYMYIFASQDQIGTFNRELAVARGYSGLCKYTHLQCAEQILALYVVTASHVCGSEGSQTTLVPSGLQAIVTLWPSVLEQMTSRLL